MSEWQPIETAPKDGIGVLGYQRMTTDIWVIVPMYFDGEVWRLLAFHGGNTEYEMFPTHWQEIPEPPK